MAEASDGIFKAWQASALSFSLGFFSPELCGGLAVFSSVGSVPSGEKVPRTPQKPPGWSLTRPEGGKTVVMLMKKPVLALC